MGPGHPMLFITFQGNRPVGPGEEDFKFKEFYPIWARRPSWSYEKHILEA